MSNNPYLDLIEQGQSVNATAGDNPYMTVVDTGFAQDQARFKASTSLALDANPDEVARQRRIAEALAIPPAAVEALPEDTARQARMVEIEKATADAPVVRRKFTDADFAKLAHDDVENLGLIEKSVRVFGDFVLRPIGGEGVGRFNQGVAGVGAAAADVVAAGIDAVTGGRVYNPARPVADFFQGLSNEGKLWADTYGIKAGDYDGVIQQGIASGTASLWQSMLLMPAALETQGVGLTNAAINTAPSLRALLPMGVVTGGQSYTEAKEKDLPLMQRLAFAGQQGGIEMLTEALPLGKFLQDIKAGAAFTTILGKQLVAENIGEQVATHWQDANEWLYLNPDKSLDDYLKARPNAALQTAVATTFATGVQTGMLHAATRNMEKAEQADRDAGNIEKLNELARASKVLQRDPAAVEALVQEAAAEGSDKVYIDANALLQSGFAQQVTEVSPAVAAQLQEKAATGGMVEIPLGEYVAKIAASEFAPQLADHVKVNPDGFTRAEAREFYQTQGDELKAQVEAQLEKAQVTDEFRASRDRVKETVLSELNSLGRFTADKNEFDATLIAARVAVRASQLGITPEAFFEQQKQRLQVQAESVTGGDSLSQGRPGTVDEATGLPLNADGTVTVYHHTSADNAALIRGEGALRSAGEPDVYVTTRRETDTGYGDTAVPIRVRPEQLVIDDEFPDGRRDFRISVGQPGGSIPVAVDDTLNQTATPYTADTIEVDGKVRPATNSEGQRIAQTEEGLRNFWRWFGDSKVVDADGKPLVVKHGSRATFSEFRAARGGMYFSTEGADVTAIFTEDGRGDAGEYYLAIGSVFDARWAAMGDAQKEELRAAIFSVVDESDVEGAAEKLGVSVEDADPFEVFTDGEFFWGYGRDLQNSVLEAIRAKGYDGVIFPDALTLGEQHTSYVAFDPEQIKQTGTFDPEQVILPEQELYQGGQYRLMAIHNLSADNLVFADKMGGIAVPSIGVVGEAKGGVDGFGEITLIGTRNLADPKGEPVFSSDAYTARFPKPEWGKVKRAAADKLVAEIRPVADEFDDNMVVSETFDGMVNTPDAGEVVSRWLRSNATQAMFLRERGVEVKPVMREANFDTGLTLEQVQSLEGDYADVMAAWRNRQSPDSAETIERVKVKVLALVKANALAEGVTGTTLDEYLEAIGDGFPRNLFNDTAKVRNGFGVDSWKTREAMRPEIDARAAEFKAWVESKVLPPFGEPFLKLGRKKVPYTLPNIVEAMTDTTVRGKEETMTYGAGQVRAASSVQFNDIEEMRAAAKESIADPAEYEKAKKESEAALEEYRLAAVPYTTYTNWKGQPDTWEALDASMRALAKWATSKKRDTAALRAALKREGFKVDALPADVLALGIKAGEALLNAPVPYFEAKPQRAVSLDEFAGAVIPANASPEVRAILDKNGIPYREVVEGTDRQSLVREFTSELSAQGADTLFQSAYHGSPYRFSKFSLEHIGRGEGVQAYGWGLYLAGRREVGEHYRRVLTTRSPDALQRHALKNGLQAEVADVMAQFHAGAKSSSFDDFASTIMGKSPSEYIELFREKYLRPAIADGSAKAVWDSFNEAGQLYEVNIPEDGEYLLWDKPLAEQPEKVRAALLGAGRTYGQFDKDATGNDLYQDLVAEFDDSDKDASMYLNSIGIAGIQYLDGASRNRPLREVKAEFLAELPEDAETDEVMGLIGTGAFSPKNEAILNALAADSWLGFDYPAQALSAALGGKLSDFDPSPELVRAVADAQDGGSYNYVIFDDAAVEILNTFYQNQQAEAPRGAFTPSTTTMTLLKNANLSTFLHEAGHYFLEGDIALVSDLLASGRELSEGEQAIASDVSALLKWFGIEGTIEDQLRQWHTMDFEERRAYHEQMAESFERYLFEGKAPSIELQPAFSRFRQWMVSVYKSLKDLLRVRPDAGKLNDEVRAVFDRMLATEEEIALAEQGRSMMPIFRTEQEATNAGLTPDEFKRIQSLGEQATEDAVRDLQARALRDLQYSRNARNREIKKLQRESLARRREVRMGVRTEVMAQPVYRAWDFLTGRVQADDKVGPVKRRKTGKKLDPSIDSLFVAMAKMGGLSSVDVAESWGITDPIPRQGFGPIVHAGGHTIGSMGEKLAESGYLAVDRNGKWDNRDFEDAFSAELRGSTVYSNQLDPSVLGPDPMAGEGINPAEVRAGRLNEASLEDMGIPAEIIEHLRNLRMVVKVGGWHPDLIAQKFGYASGDEMVRTVAAAENPRIVVEGLTDARMLEQYGELATPEAIEREADKAIHNEVRARMVATEANALARATGKPKILVEAAKSYASTMVARLRIGDLRRSAVAYANAETRAAKAAAKAIKSGDLATAAAEKRNQTINVYAVKVANDAVAEVDKLLRSWAEFARRADDKLVKTYDMDIVNAVRVILGQYGIAPAKSKKASEYIEVLKTNDPEMYAVVSEAVAAAEANAKPFKDLTVEQVRGLKDEIDTLLHIAKRSRQLELGGDLIDRQEVEDQLYARLEEIGIPDTIPGEVSAVTPAEKRMAQFKGLLAFATRVESWAKNLDGKAWGGPFTTYVYGTIKRAANAYRTDKAARLAEFRALVDSIAPTLKRQIIAAPELGYTFGKDSGGSAINEILHAILHTGNESNKRKLLLGRGWATETSDGMLETGRWDGFIARMVAEGKITQAHFDFAQGVWDMLESTKPLAQKTHRDVFGKYFDEVTANEFVDPFGITRRGGYVPAMVDSRVAQDADLRKMQDAENASMAYAFPTTPKGFTKARVEYNRPLMLDLRTLAQHIDKVLLFSHMEMPVRDVQRLLSKKVGSGLARVAPGAVNGLLTPWLRRSALQQVETPIAGDHGWMRVFSVLRARAGMAAMFGNLANAVQQVTGFSMAAVMVKPRLLKSAMVDYMKGPKELAASVSEASEYMRIRMDNEVAVMTDAINDILLNPSLLERGEAWTKKHAYFLQSAFDNTMSPVIWTAAYNQASEAGSDHDTAVQFADGVIRQTQGSTLAEDISRIEGGNTFVRMFTQFAGYFNMQANLLGSEFVALMREQGLRKGYGRGIYVFTMGFLIPAVVGELIMQLFRGGPDDDDDDGYTDDWLAALFLWAPLRNATAMAPGVGQGVNSVVNTWNSKPYDDRLASSPAVSMLESAAKAPVSVYKAVAEDGSPQRAVRDVGTLISMSVGLPGNLAARPIGYLAGVAAGDIEPTGPVDAVRGTVTGTASPASK